MNDFLGNPLAVGDYVVFHRAFQLQSFVIGKILEINGRHVVVTCKTLEVKNELIISLLPNNTIKVEDEDMVAYVLKNKPK
jgi:hydrogenase maturation factor